MARVAIVTGGTRGIGRAICEALKADGMTVVANYAGNEEKARAFTDETGIAAYKWDVGDHAATMAGCGPPLKGGAQAMIRFTPATFAVTIDMCADATIG